MQAHFLSVADTQKMYRTLNRVLNKVSKDIPCSAVCVKLWASIQWCTNTTTHQCIRRCGFHATKVVVTIRFRKGHTKVSNLYMIIGIKENIIGFQIAMNDSLKEKKGSSKYVVALSLHTHAWHSLDLWRELFRTDRAIFIMYCLINEQECFIRFK